ncbi:MAG: tRNA lysidine(34) synthetase TilS [Oscillospiraceae bacterium]|nr:tRNA lysidine(34) synthetase TilS [Oscillospiraceae bacterium]
MLNKLETFVRRYDMIVPGDHIICAVSGGADSVALLFGLYLLKDKLKIQLSAAHFNHHLRDEESDRDEAFVRNFCDGYQIPLFVGSGNVVAGKKGLEAAARDARYAFLRSLPGKIATAHTADDNAETVLLHLVRGTGLKGLGAIAPVNGSVIRPMLAVTRQDVEDFMAEYYLPHITDSSNETDGFLRNRLRHHVMPLLTAENPRLAENLSAMALRLRQDEQALSDLAAFEGAPRIEQLRAMPAAVRARALERFLKESGVREPEAAHIQQAEALTFSDNPSAEGHFPGGITITRNYGILEKKEEPVQTACELICSAAEDIINTADTFTVQAQGTIYVRSRQAGDTIRLSGGTKSVKKLFIDKKIPAAQRPLIPIVCDDLGILAIGGIGVNLDRAAKELPATRIRIKL